MQKLRRLNHKIDMVFVLALFMIFAATAFIVVLIGARQYRSTADNMNYNYEVRTASSYIEEKIRQNDSAARISITDLSGTTALALTSEENGIFYTTYIYYYDGSLRELFAADNAEVGPQSGQKIIELGGFLPEYADDDLIKVTFTDSDGGIFPVYLSVHSESGKEDL